MSQWQFLLLYAHQESQDSGRPDFKQTITVNVTVHDLWRALSGIFIDGIPVGRHFLPRAFKWLSSRRTPLYLYGCPALLKVNSGY